MAAVPSVGVLAQFGLSAFGTDSVTPYALGSPPSIANAFEFLNESLTTEQEVIRTEGIRGTRLHPAERVRQGRIIPGGSVSMQPTYAEMVQLLPRIFGVGTANTGYTVYAIAEKTGQVTLPAGVPGGSTFTWSSLPQYFRASVDRVAKVYVYDNAKVNRATLRSAPGQPLDVTLEIEALTEAVNNAGTFPSLTVSATAPFVFHDAVITLGGTVYQVLELETTIDWHLKTDRFANSQTRTDLVSLDCTVATRFTVPFTSDTAALYNASAWAGGVPQTYPYGITGVANFSWGGAGLGAAGVSLALYYGNLIFPAKKSPAVQSKDEIGMVLEGEARGAGTVTPLACVLDSTP